MLCMFVAKQSLVWLGLVFLGSFDIMAMQCVPEYQLSHIRHHSQQTPITVTKGVAELVDRVFET